MSAARPGMRRATAPGRWSAGVLIAAFLIGVFAFFPSPSEGLMPLWIAGQFMNAGQFDQVYTVAAVPFDMRPPADWPAFMAGTHSYHGPIGPYLQPPVWGALTGLLRGVDFWRFSSEALVINAALMMGAVWLAIAAARPRFPPAIHALVAALLLLWTPIGAQALARGDPAIMTGFLLVLAFERRRAGAEVAGGAALGLAVAWAGWPVLLLPLFAGRDVWRGPAAAVAVLAALAAVSLAWLGGAVHVAYLRQGLALWQSVVCGPASAGLDCALGTIVAPGAFQPASPAGVPIGRPAAQDWASMARPLAWQLLSLLALAGALAWARRAWASADDIRRMLIWPLTIALILLLLPAGNAWGFLPLAAFAPILIDRLGPIAGSAVCALGLALLSTPLARLLDTAGTPGTAVHASAIVGFAGIAVLAAGLAAAHRRWRIKATQPRIA